ncbi:hypothetical protein R7127_20850 [Vibrio sp. 1159]|uniref:hypothetical protein n=1 Tax=Vibrio sp. 1159 TaxID=3074545 RepID=UPI0029645DBF|nr:hypothetical protein [Vibrio sp. 1159]MDW2322721.1 hypothetical protein [Vibrio sp. 1159]
MLPIISFAFSKEQTKHWQQEVISQAQRQTQSGHLQQSTQSIKVMMPVLDTSDTLSGVDSQHDGIRDDIQFYIDSLPEADSNKASLTNYAKSLQLTMTVDTTDVIEVKSVVDGMLFNVACLVLKHDDTQLANQYVKQLSAFTRNTKARYEQGKKLDAVYSGSVYRLPETEECE